MYVRIYIYTYMCIYTYMYMYVYISSPIHALSHAHSHTHSHAQQMTHKAAAQITSGSPDMGNFLKSRRPGTSDSLRPNSTAKLLPTTVNSNSSKLAAGGGGGIRGVENTARPRTADLFLMRPNTSKK